ncbi:MAG: 3-phosphoshikimate 1-carboxyvinyltransferase [Oscillospiraceae bacterium]|jgi:3-phosphoshikimate 1-carboxyvinyltransferase
MDITVKPGPLSGTVAAIPSKSDAHRLLIASFLSGYLPELSGFGDSDDINSTYNCLLELQAWQAGGKNPVLDCGESGSSLRFLLPVAAALGAPATFTGRGRLPLRPLEPLLSQMSLHGVSFSSNSLPFTISGTMSGGSFTLPGDLSSQYITGLLFALPLCGGGEIRLTSPLQSAGYVDMTLGTLRRFGIDIERFENSFLAPPAAYIRRESILPEGDWSNAAFWLCAGALGGPVGVTGLSEASFQGDRSVLRILREFGAEVEGCVVKKGRFLHGITIDAGDIPDLIPVLSVVAAGAQGETHIQNASRLRLKESDRLDAIARNLTALGADVTQGHGSLIIRGNGSLKGGVVSGYNDHRIVMSAAIASIICKSPVTITGCEAVGKSYSSFFEDFQKLGGIINVQHLR